MPKIEARRDPDAPDVHEVVTKVAERNPQKLRQIGMNYDLANARGVAELSAEEKKQQDEEKQKAASRKKGQKEAADKEKAEFEAWKKDREEYEAWKSERKQSQKTTKTDLADSSMSEAKSAPDKANKDVEGTSAGFTVKSDHDATDDDSKAGANETKPTDGISGLQRTREKPELPFGGTGMTEHISRPDRGRRLSAHAYDDSLPNIHGDEPIPEAGANAPSPTDNKPKTWNAVCVLGLRVYSQDPEVNIKLVKPKDAEEGAILDVGGDTAAGATM